MLLTRNFFFCHVKTWPKWIGMPFLCVIHIPQNCMKWIKSAFRCWNLCFRMILWCFNPVNTTHLFLWDKITSFGCGVIARLWVQTTVFGICLWQSLNNSTAHLSNTQRHRMTMENLILDGQVRTLFSENKTMSRLHCQRWKCFLPSILKLFEEMFYMQSLYFIYPKFQAYNHLMQNRSVQLLSKFWIVRGRPSSNKKIKFVFYVLIFTMDKGSPYQCS